MHCRQSSGWAARTSSRSLRLMRRSSLVWVLIRIPDRASVIHARLYPGSPSTSTMHIPQVPSGVISSCLHRVGISIPAFSAASRMVVPVSTCTALLSIVRLSILYYLPYVVLLPDKPLNLIAELIQKRVEGGADRLPEGTEGGCPHYFSGFPHQGKIVLFSAAGGYAAGHITQLTGAVTTGEALAAGFFGKEAHTDVEHTGHVCF